MRHNSPQYALLAGALMGHPSSPESAWDWERTVAIAAREEVLPSLRDKLPCPSEISSFFEGIHDLNDARNTQLLRELESLAFSLNQEGIEPVLLKGAAYLVTGVYSHPADRFLHDIDLLVCPLQSRRAFEIVAGAGYEPYVPNPSALFQHHHPSLTQIQRVPVEIHHRLGHGACNAILPADEIVNGSTTFPLGCAVVRVPSPEHLMTHLILHSQLQHGAHERIWPSLRAMLDLVLLDRRVTPDWDAIRTRFGIHGKTALLNLHLLQVASALGNPPPFPITTGGIRWLYRRALWWEPRLRYVDPFYTSSRMVLPKIRMSLRLLGHPLGRKYVLAAPFRLSFYKRLLDDLAHG